MAIVGLRRDAAQWYTLKGDPDPDNPSEFLLAPLSARQMSFVKDESTGYIANPYGDDELLLSHRTNHQFLLAVRMGLRGWRNVIDAEEKEIKFSLAEQFLAGTREEYADDATLDVLGFDAIRELGERVITISRLSETARKNSDRSSSRKDSSPTESARPASPPTRSDGDAKAEPGSP